MKRADESTAAGTSRGASHVTPGAGGKMPNKCVRDLMLSLDQCATVHENATIRDALISLDNAQLRLGIDRPPFRTVLVLDDDQHVVGKLTYWSILRRIEPGFLRCSECVMLSRVCLSPEVIESLNTWLSGFANNLSMMCAEAAKTRARDAMIPVAGSVDGDTSLPDAIHELVSKDLQMVPVRTNGETVGILRASDVFEEIGDLIYSSVN